MSDVPLREYIEKVLGERDKNIEIRFDSAKEALSKATKELDKKLMELNQLRREVEEDRNLLVRRDTYEVEYKTICKQMEENSTRLTKIETKIITWGSLAFVVVVIIQILVFLSR